MAELAWTGDAAFRIGEVQFELAVDTRFVSGPTNFLLVKHRHMVERYLELLDRLQPRHAVELGIYEGGSAAFLAMYCQPERLAVFDLRPDRVQALDGLIAARGLADRVHAHYGFDQADEPRLRAAVADEFAGHPLDLVIDDASHRLAPTRTSFNVLFPLLRPGGVFVIEDWSGLHLQDLALRDRASTDADLEERLAIAAVLRKGVVGHVPLSVLVFELVLAAAYAPGVFAEIVVAEDWVHVVRGPGVLDPATFDLARSYPETVRQLIGRTE